MVVAPSEVINHDHIVMFYLHNVNYLIHALGNRAKLLTLMRFSRSGRVAPAVGAWILMSLAASCGGSSGPTGPQPAPVTNTPPTVSAIGVRPPRAMQPETLATVGDRIALTVTVTDPETAPGDLTYEWTANPNIGTFSGSGGAVEWTAPAAVTSPRAVALLVTVVERYQGTDANGQPGQREHRVQQSATLRVHDSVKEIGDMAVDFLTQFSNSSVDTDVVMRNFSRTCDGGRGYTEERGDVQRHRDNYTMLSYDIGTPEVTFAFGSTSAACDWPGTPGDACAKVRVEWNDEHKTTGERNTVIGNDFVSAVYEGDRWFLCHSRFQGISSLRFHQLFSRGGQ